MVVRTGRSPPDSVVSPMGGPRGIGLTTEVGGWRPCVPPSHEGGRRERQELRAHPVHLGPDGGYPGGAEGDPEDSGRHRDDFTIDTTGRLPRPDGGGVLGPLAVGGLGAGPARPP